MKKYDVLGRLNAFQFIGAFVAILFSFLLFILPFELQWVRGVVLVLLLSTLVLMVIIQYQGTQRSIKMLTESLKSLAGGNKNNIDLKWIRVSPLFKYVQRISNRYAELEHSIDHLIHNRSYKTAINANSENIFVNSLVKLETHLAKIADEEQQWKTKEEIRAWTNQGIAKFSDLLRQHSNSITGLSEKVLQELVNYVGANQGGIFLIEQEEQVEPFFKMVAAYAYDRVKCPDKKVPIDEGLLAAICFEQKTMYMTN